MNKKLFKEQLMELINRGADEVLLEENDRERIVKAIYNKAMEALNSKLEGRRWKGLSKKKSGFYFIGLRILDADNFDCDYNYFTITITIHKDKVLSVGNNYRFKDTFFKNVKSHDVFVEVNDLYESGNLDIYFSPR